MGKKGNWFSAVKKALSPESKDKKDQVWNLWFNYKRCYFGFLDMFVIGIWSFFAILENSYVKEKLVWETQEL